MIGISETWLHNQTHSIKWHVKLMATLAILLFISLKGACRYQMIKIWQSSSDSNICPTAPTWMEMPVVEVRNYGINESVRISREVSKTN
ncbi:hypothetical protein ACJX0J_017094, partial [Zea mays]